MKDKLLVFLLSVILVSGCATSKKDPQTRNPAVLEPQATLKLGDVPIPVGFKLLPAQSYSFESSGFRVGLLKYQGKVDAEGVVSFYKEQMPLYNWNLLNIVEFGERLLNFDRETETCIISLLSKGSLTTITVSIGPKSQIAKNKARPVK